MQSPFNILKLNNLYKDWDFPSNNSSNRPKGKTQTNVVDGSTNNYNQ
jgi:hypothetical protein